MGAGAGECAEVYVVRLCGFATILSRSGVFVEAACSRIIVLIVLDQDEECAAGHAIFWGLERSIPLTGPLVIEHVRRDARML